MDRKLVKNNYRVATISTLVIIVMVGAGFAASVIYLGGTP